VSGRRRLTDFEHVLLGTIMGVPKSAYDLKKWFATTPAGIYQPSPGALYPALRRLESFGLIRVQEEVSAGRRRRRMFLVTGDGLAAHRQWLREPVEPPLGERAIGLHLMRFVMMEHQLPRAEVLAFLDSFILAHEDFIAEVEKYTSYETEPGYHPQLALRHGIDIHQTSLAWARRAREFLERSPEYPPPWPTPDEPGQPDEPGEPGRPER
jgi:DNA-binding PadR family transcriptional regulator